MQDIQQMADLRLPHLWYPAARALDRKIVYHAGPTNSGKTYAALEALAQANHGVYCGPLRLLALEVHERLNADGVVTDLVTGQEKKVRLPRPALRGGCCCVLWCCVL